MQTGHIKRYLINSLLLCTLWINSQNVFAADNNEIIEFQGDRYVIHVSKMNPDSEMTLLDLLNTCPEFLSLNGKEIDHLPYSLRVDNIGIVTDEESFLANVKACEIDRIQICSNSSVAKAVSGTTGVIDIYYREDVKTDGKAAVTGSTYGNGMLYTDFTNRNKKLAIQGYAMVRTSYGKAYPTDIQRMTNRSLAENVHLNLDWKMSGSDRLIVKAFQKYENGKTKLFNPDLTAEHPSYGRYFGLVLSYSHTFRNDAILYAEMGSDYTRNAYDGSKLGDRYPYAFVELNTPIFTPDLWLMVGTEVDYENTLYIGNNREQYLLTDFYAQLDFTHGPWVFTLGDRFRLMNFWNRHYDSADRSLWNHNRNNHSYLASAGLKAGRNFFQVLFTRRFFIPGISDFLTDESAPTTALKYSGTGYSTNIVHQGVLRYSYQQKNFFFHTSVESNWYSHLPGPNYLQFGFRNSVFWKIGRWELTMGANFYHNHLNASANTASENSNFVTLKLAPVLNLPLGFRLSSTLLYSSKRTMDVLPAHLFATVKLNKQFGKKVNIFAEFHDLAGYPTGNWIQLADLYQNRALSIGATIYPFRK